MIVRQKGSNPDKTNNRRIEPRKIGSNQQSSQKPGFDPDKTNNSKNIGSNPGKMIVIKLWFEPG